MAIEYHKKPVILAAIICAVIFYSPGFKKYLEGNFHCLLDRKEIYFVKGQIKSSLTKSSNGNYSADFCVTEVFSEKGKGSSAKGTIKIYIPQKMAESYFPGKLYSASKNKDKFYFDKGEFCTFQGKLSGRNFYVQDCTQCSYAHNFFGKISEIRSLCRLQFMRLMYSWNEGGGLLLALLCGVREYTEEATSNSFKRAGLSHILALSGMHLGMFSSLALFIGNKIKRKRVSTILRISAIFIFVWFAGFSPSLERAFICSILGIIVGLAGCEQPDMLVLLCFSFLFQSVISPSHITNAAFILSYAALFGILLTGRFFYIWTSKYLPKIISSPLSSSLGAQLTTAPVSLKLFGTFSPFGTVATIVVSPIVTIFIYSGIILILLSLIFPFMQKPGGFFINFLYNIIKYTVGIFSMAPVISI